MEEFKLKITKASTELGKESTHYNITAECMIEIDYMWHNCETVVTIQRETEKAYFGDVVVYNADYHKEIYVKESTWIPKSMSCNVWWICTILFGHTGKVSNKRFEVYD